MLVVFGRSFRTSSSSSCPTSGWTTPKPSLDFKRCLTTASKTTLYPKLLSCVETSPADRLSRGVGRIFNDIMARWDLLSSASRTEFHSTENFDSLGQLIASYPQITRTTHFVFVPGPLDLTSNVTLPRKPILSSFTSQIRAKVPKVHFASNPCRLKFFAQEIVIFREDTMARMLRNTVEVKPNVMGEDLRRYV